MSARPRDLLPNEPESSSSSGVHRPFFLTAASVASISLRRLKKSVPNFSLATSTIKATNLDEFKFINPPHFPFLCTIHDLQLQRIESDEAAGVVLVVGFARAGFHRGDAGLYESRLE